MKAKIDLANAQRAVQECENKCRYEDTLVRNLEVLREALLQANRDHLERRLVFFLHRFASITLLFRRLNTSRTSANYEQKNNVLEVQRKARQEARTLQQQTNLTSLITPPPGAGAPVTYNLLQLPSPPSSLVSCFFLFSSLLFLVSFFQTSRATK
jgi:hypothetical protein